MVRGLGVSCHKRKEVFLPSFGLRQRMYVCMYVCIYMSVLYILLLGHDVMVLNSTMGHDLGSDRVCGSAHG